MVFSQKKNKIAKRIIFLAKAWATTNSFFFLETNTHIREKERDPKQ